jgi:hypothetical protein
MSKEILKTSWAELPAERPHDVDTVFRTHDQRQRMAFSMTTWVIPGNYEARLDYIVPAGEKYVDLKKRIIHINPRDIFNYIFEMFIEGLSEAAIQRCGIYVNCYMNQFINSLHADALEQFQRKYQY